MAPKARKPTPLLPSTPKRDHSPELGSPSKITQYNKSTGRPIRRGAGKAKKVAGYVDSRIIEEGEFASLTSGESQSESEDEHDMDQRGRAGTTKRRAKRKRSPSPPSPRLDPIIYDEEQLPLTDDEDGGSFHRHTPRTPPITLQFNVPLGFHGPLFVKLDSAILKSTEEAAPHDMQPGSAKNVQITSTHTTPEADRDRPVGFNDLPPELRNTIYRYLFARKDKNHEIRIPPPKSASLCRSTQFLRTCKLVYSEGCSILYGENTFFLVRHYATRGPFWETIPKEIGYQDVLHFLKMIGQENVQYLRDIKFSFDDALPKDTPYMDSHEKRRYLNDEYLMHCLRILRHGKLRIFHMQFNGRRRLLKSDVKFLGYLEQIKADEVVKIPDQWFHTQNKFRELDWTELKQAMTRKKKLYEK